MCHAGHRSDAAFSGALSRNLMCQNPAGVQSLLELTDARLWQAWLSIDRVLRVQQHLLDPRAPKGK